MIKNHKGIIVLFLCFTLILNGCWDYRDINSRNIIISLGIDKEKDNVIFAGEIVKSNYEAAKGEEGGNKGTSIYCYEAKGANFEEARWDYDRQTPFQEFFGGIRSVVYSEEYARKEGIQTYLNRFNLSYDYRKSILMAVSEERCSDLFKKKLKNDISVGVSIDDTMLYLKEDGKALYITVGDVLTNLSLTTIGSLLPYIKIIDGSVNFIGYGIFNEEGRMVGTILGKDNIGLLYLLGKDPSIRTVMPRPGNPENQISYEVGIKKRKIKTRYENGTPIIDIDLKLVSSIKYQYYREELDVKMLDRIRQHMELDAKYEIEKVLKKSQEEYRIDFLNFGKYFKGQNYNIYKNIDWKKEYPKAKINVNVKMKINDINLKDPNSKVKN
ncbi:Ger(x)C family spore germination protein [Hathewaya limosa]|uniref:Spore germination protein KC n=1 Tax=Hathewaya limosa TaxID=1536 RepID=A0ABU0JSA9_HATLI|nr:Ger(x)C family spore germination protein [Hathewaya limosa]MDQ0479987.1 spore germination protein KC [Hathewaya limosa]